MMKSIKNSIVFSNDIERIMKGNNALQFDYQSFCVLPGDSFFKELRKSFRKDTSRIFDGKVIIIEEEEMEEAMSISIQDVLGKVPHCITR